jgi:hypothetical protein
MGMSKLDELIRQEKHPAIQLVLRALAHVRDKIESGADVSVLYGDDHLAVETKTGKLIIKRVEIDNVDRVRVVFMKINKSCEGSTKVVLKQYVINHNPQILSDLIYEIDYIIEYAVLDGVNVFEERIDNVITALKTLSK